MIFKEKLTIDQLLVIGQIIEKVWIQAKCREIRQIQNAYDSIYRKSLYNIIYEFGFPSKLVSLTKICMEGTKYQESKTYYPKNF